MSEDKTASVPLACSLNKPDKKAYRHTTIKTLQEAVQETIELPDGYDLRFPGDESWSGRLMDFIAYERQCCPFLSFGLRFEPDNGPIWLRIQGPEGVKALVQAEVAAATANL